MQNWKLLVEKSQAKNYTLPAGWDTKEKVAEKLECSEGNVNKLLASAIKSKAVEVKAFPVFDKITKKVLRLTAYRQVSPP
jgi:DNA-binding transcriptional regulator LsrR (DeoR family)